MKENRTFVVGDIHGCLDPLRRLMEKIDWDPAMDSMIFVGDYIDRGENSKEVVDFMLDLIRDSPNIECLMGNHESMFLEYMSGRNRDLYFMNGGLCTIKSYSRNKGFFVPEDHLNFYGSLKMYIELERHIVVHAGFRPGRAFKEQDAQDMLWIRDPFIYSDHDFGKQVIFGHTPFEKPLIEKNKIGIDTGAVYGGSLTCLELNKMMFYSVK